MMNYRGFTLIELLVVISIMGFLSSVVVASLKNARDKAQEAAIKADLYSIKTQAELSYGKTGDYSNTSNEIASILAHINKNNAIANFYTYDNSQYAVSVKSKISNTKNWSVSSKNGVTIWDTADSPTQNSWYAAKAYCESSGGRLPTREELKALFVNTNQPGFQSCQGANRYWSGSDYPNAVEAAWTACYTQGNTYSFKNYSTNFLRCVR